MTETQAPDEPGVDATRENFQLKHVAAQNIERQQGAREGFIAMMHLNAAQAGVITRAEADAFAKRLAEAADRGAFHMSLTMYAVSAVKGNAV